MERNVDQRLVSAGVMKMMWVGYVRYVGKVAIIGEFNCASYKLTTR
jgi:hypothetical protein